MEVDARPRDRVIRRQVGAAAEPRALALVRKRKLAWTVGTIRVARVQHQRDAGRGEGAPLAGRSAGELLGQLAVDVGEVDAGLLEDRAVLQHAGTPAAAALAPPVVLAEAPPPRQSLRSRGRFFPEGKKRTPVFVTSYPVSPFENFCAAICPSWPDSNAGCAARPL